MVSRAEQFSFTDSQAGLPSTFWVFLWEAVKRKAPQPGGSLALKTHAHSLLASFWEG